MKKNLGQVDRIARLFVGSVILIVAAQFGSWWGLLGLALIATGAIGYCGLYRIFGFSSCEAKVSAQPQAPTNQQPPVAPQQ